MFEGTDSVFYKTKLHESHRYQLMGQRNVSVMEVLITRYRVPEVSVFN